MKKIVIQLLQWIFKYRKKIIYGFFAFLVGQICFFNLGGIGIENEVYAVSNENAEQRQQFEGIVNEKLKLIDFFRKAIYVLVYPILFLAGKLVDNSFVYGEVFQFDVVLWKLWNIVRNLANYGLGFMFLYYIFKYLIKKDEKEGPKWIVKNALIAGIGIQASWFIMAVLIDISTILTYSVGGLPISILGGGGSSSAGEMIEKDQDYDPYIMKTIVSVDADDIANMNIYLTNIPVKDGGQEIIYVSECDTFSHKYADGQKIDEIFILGPKMIYYMDAKKDESGGDKGGNYHSTQELLCDYYGSVYWFPNLVPKLKEPWKDSGDGWGCSGDKDCKDKQIDYDGKKSEVKNDIAGTDGKLDEYLKSHQVLKIGEIVSEKVGWDQDNNWVSEKYKTQQLHQLVKNQDTKSYVGVFTALYASLMEAGRGTISVVGQSDYVQFLGGLVDLGHVLAISIPLIATLFVLIMRIGIIWLAIVLSPMIVLFTVFGLSNKIGSENILKYLKVENLIWIIFSPAIICFAISMSTVLVRLIEKISFDQHLIEPLVFGGVIQMNIAGFSVGLGRLITGIMGIAISWFLVWMAVQSSELGNSKFIKDLKGLATDALGSVKFIPIPGKNGQGQLASVNALKNVYNQKVQKVKENFADGDSQAVRELFNGSDEAEKASKKREEVTQTNKVQTFVDGLKGLKAGTITNKWMEGIDVVVDGKKETMKFNEFDGEQKKKIIEKINDLSEDVLKNIGTVTPKIPVSNDVTYVFNGKKFEIENQK